LFIRVSFKWEEANMNHLAIAVSCLVALGTFQTTPGLSAELVPYNPPRSSRATPYGAPQQVPAYEVPQQVPAYPAPQQQAPATVVPKQQAAPPPQVPSFKKPAVAELSPDETKKVDQLAAEVRKLDQQQQSAVREGIRKQLDGAVKAGDLRQIRYYDRLLQKIEYTK
jgi:hypothetical protein